MNNREEIKWAPFDSLFHSSEVLKELQQKQKVVSKPLLSEDELKCLEENILRASHTQELVEVEYYFKGLIYHKQGIIDFIKKNDLKIYFQDHSSLYFEQILNIKTL